MKKLLISACFAFLSLVSVSAENIRFQVKGPESSYNQIRIVNGTSVSDFDCKIYKLQKNGQKYVVNKEVGTVHLRGINDIDSLSRRISEDDEIGIAFSTEIENLSYVVSYKDFPFFDVIMVYLTDGISDGFDENIIGREF